MRFNSLGHSGEGDTRQMEYKEDKSLNAVNVWGAPVIHPPSLLHSLSVWPYPTCMTPDHSSSLCPFITPVASSFHFSAPRPELPSPVTDDAVWVDYLEYHEGCMVKYLLTKVIMCAHSCGIRQCCTGGFILYVWAPQGFISWTQWIFFYQLSIYIVCWLIKKCIHH